MKNIFLRTVISIVAFALLTIPLTPYSEAQEANTRYSSLL